MFSLTRAHARGEAERRGELAPRFGPRRRRVTFFVFALLGGGGGRGALSYGVSFAASRPRNSTTWPSVLPALAADRSEPPSSQGGSPADRKVL